MMWRKTYLYFFLLILAVSCKTNKDSYTVNNAIPKNIATADLKKAFEVDIKVKESISKSACRVGGVVIEKKEVDEISVILQVTSFLGEGASFSTYRPYPGDKIEVGGLKSVDYTSGDTLKIEIQTLAEKPNQQIQKVELIKILDL